MGDPNKVHKRFYTPAEAALCRPDMVPKAHRRILTTESWESVTCQYCIKLKQHTDSQEYTPHQSLLARLIHKPKGAILRKGGKK